MAEVEKLLKRYKKASDNKRQWESIIKDCYRYALPNKETIDKHSPGQEKNTHIYDSTAVVALKKYANRMQHQLVPPWKSWMTLQAGSEIPEDQKDDVNKYLENVSNIIFDHINHSNFSTQINEAFMDLGISMGAIIVEAGDGIASHLNFRSVSLSEISVERSEKGVIDNVWREFEIPVSEIESIYIGSKLTPKLTKVKERKPDAMVKLVEGVYFEDYKGQYEHVLIHEESKALLFEEYTDTSPWVVFRESVVSGETIGRGRIMDILPDIKTLNKIVEFNLRNAALSISGIYTASDDGVINPYTINLQPGAIIPVGSNDNSNPTLRPLERSGDFTVAQLEMQYYRDFINNYMFAQPFGELNDTPVRTATEMGIRQEDLAQTSGSAFGRMQTELLERIIKRSVDILKKAGKIPEMRVDGKEVTIKFTSPMARSQDAEDVQNVMGWFQSIAQLGPEVIMGSVKVEALPRFMAEKMNVPASLLYTEAEQQQAKQRLAEAAAQMTPEQMGAIQ